MSDNKPDYKSTLNLPQTDFAMKANLPQREPDILAKWNQLDIYNALRKNRKGKNKFVLHLGPPYANGNIHLGTATTTLLKDLIVKAKTMSGFDSPLVPGWDCHGLPIEHNVEKKIGKAGQKVNAKEFRDACREYARSFINIQREEFKRLGIIADWENPYLTLDPMYEANIIRSLAKIIKNKHMQKGFKPVHWCLDCASALAEAEVEYIDKTSPSVDVRFELPGAKNDVANIAGAFGVDLKNLILVDSAISISIPIWTTTPWTLPANEAVALNPLLNYALVECQNEKHEWLIIAEDLLTSTMERYQISKYTVLGSVTGEKLVEKLNEHQYKLKHPFYDKEVPVVLGEHVTIESGTGAVHTAPAHGVDDYQVGKKYKLPLINPVGNDGCYISSTPLFAGTHVSKADEKILAELKSRGTLLHLAKVVHSYPHCWRHKTPLIFRATPQWFVSMDQNQLRQSAEKAVNSVEWIPDWGKSRIGGMIENRPDWCISRQRTWGVPLAIFEHKETGDMHPDTLALMEKVAQSVEKNGIEGWHQIDQNALLGETADQYKKNMDVLDVWFESGVSHECVLRKRPELTFPADIVLEGTDQHRGWFQSSLLTSVAINNVASYKEVLTHGFVVDANGIKMSKSIGNVIAPEEVIKTMGADILRLWVASIDYRYEITASKEILTRTSETYRRLRNTVRFFLSNLNDFNPETDLVSDEEMLMLDRYAVDRARIVQDEIVEAYDSYQFHQIVQKLHNFCVTDMGGFYLDVIKDRQYTMAKDSIARRSAQTALYHIAQAFTRWIAPILSFTAEEIWQYLPGKKAESVMLTTWYMDLAILPQDDFMNAAYWERIRAVRDAVNKEIENQRAAGKLGSALEAEVQLFCGSHLKEQLDALENELRFVLITSSASVISDSSAPLDALATDVPGLSLKVFPTKYAKCERCWHRREDVNANSDYPGLCGRCVENVAGKGEMREYA